MPKGDVMNIDVKLISQNFSNVEFFLACAFPTQAPVFSGNSDDVSIMTAPDFCAISSRSPSSGAGLTHDISGKFLVFRGYEASIGVHSYSQEFELAQIADPENLK